jgi:hypothetical protein
MAKAKPPKTFRWSTEMITIVSYGLVRCLNEELTMLRNCRVRLWVNPNVIVTINTVKEDLVECTLGGYAPLVLTNWSNAAFNAVTFRAEITHPDWTTTFTAVPAAQTIYGWYVTDSPDNKLVMLEPIVPPFTVTTVGQALTIRLYKGMEYIT